MNKTKRKFEHETNHGAMFRLAALQAFGTMVFALSMYYCFDLREALSAFFGGLVATTMSLFMATRLFGAYRISLLREVAAGEALIRFYISVVLKMIFTLAMMTIFIVVIEVSILPFIIAYLIAAVIVNLLFLYLDATKAAKVERLKWASNKKQQDKI
ncbi:hypothetical protein NBRC116583_05360 [Arenicella sp. 4NH20-0111]|uniref:ATP synthase subunit I n=1 Tax=Arenicella sp. 4NH20-0111 TaxID=3127648 RepID=UPI00310BBA0F